ncbi:basic amino acid ABC transporter substrate-binding protein [Halanaerobium hydrogeniformans]|uniref:Extracellular solute-binding protein family 3 n=1 Tax=Halanaerobium hydrogeniformans TaxID=656519 RepID=E4RPG0_HALHG|nr:basic amino acid ABC transporter substrate-binding protein [Halanaerobium hydrogeniformans]ADQ13983.1 extracellular solute-binding protein family 3 [Halanaerobium hydrogeniformans]
MKKILVLMLLVFAVFAFSFSAYAETYVVGTSAGFPPFEYVEDGEIVGFDMDLITEIGNRQGFEVEFRDISFDSLIPALTTGSIDIIAAAMTITEERAEVLDFSDPYYSANQAVLVHEDSEEGLTILFGDNDIGVQTGTTGDIWVQDHLVEPGILTGNVRNYDSFVLVIRDLANQNIDGVVLDKPVGETYSQGNPVKVVAEIITGEEYGMAVAQGNDELLEKINAGLEEVREDGTMDELIEKYFE